jgi:hypothetical protein
MVEECVHVNEKGHKCRRIPKRGQKLCPAHRAKRRRGILEEDTAFLEGLDIFTGQLRAMNLENLLYATNGALADIHGLIDRRSSRRDRAAYMRATIAVGEAQDRIFLELAGYRADARTTTSRTAGCEAISPGTPPEPRKLFALPPTGLPAGTPQLSPEELQAACAQLLSILDPNGTISSTLNSDT